MTAQNANNTGIETALLTCTPIGLHQLGDASLMERKETKFVSTYALLPTLLSALSTSARVLEVHDRRQFSYETLYFDTKDYDCYHDHHNGKLNRQKVRFRKYPGQDNVFLEVKSKTNTGRTKKTRISKPSIEEHINGGAEHIIHAQTPFSSDELSPVLWVKYDRITFVSDNERLTIDRNLRYNRYGRDKTIPLDNMCVLELKQAQRDTTSDFFKLLRDVGAHEMRVSKYCLGVVLTGIPAKHNRMKPKLQIINKLRGLNEPGTR